MNARPRTQAPVAQIAAENRSMSLPCSLHRTTDGLIDTNTLNCLVLPEDVPREAIGMIQHAQVTEEVVHHVALVCEACLHLGIIQQQSAIVIGEDYWFRVAGGFTLLRDVQDYPRRSCMTLVSVS